MVQITYVEHGGKRHAVDGPIGLSLMDVAQHFRIPGIEGDCGGFAACATCHIYVDPPFADRIAAIEDLERATLQCAHDVTAASRLACQVPVTRDLDGIVVRLPSRQY